MFAHNENIYDAQTFRLKHYRKPSGNVLRDQSVNKSITDTLDLTYSYTCRVDRMHKHSDETYKFRRKKNYPVNFACFMCFIFFHFPSRYFAWHGDEKGKYQNVKLAKRFDIVQALLHVFRLKVKIQNLAMFISQISSMKQL